MPSSLLDHLQSILPLVEKIEDEIVCEKTEKLGEMVSQMFEVMQKIAKFLCEYVKRGRFSRRALFWIPQMLMITERTGAALFASKDKVGIKELDEELANVIKQFQNAVNVEALCIAKNTGKHSLSQYSVRPFLIALCRGEVSTRAAQSYQDRL